MSKAIFVIGTGTDIGKTYVTGLIVKKLKEAGLKCGYYKAAMSGNIRDDRGKPIPQDAVFVKEISGIGQSLEDMCPFVYEHAYSPHLAARIEGNAVKLPVVAEKYENLKTKYDYITVEGSGGIMCPLSFDESEFYLEDIIRMLGADCILVADAGLGTINNVVLTCEYAKSRGININGIIYNRYIPNNPMHDDNIRMCEHLTGLKTLAKVKENDDDLEIDEKILVGLYKQESVCEPAYNAEGSSERGKR